MADTAEQGLLGERSLFRGQGSDAKPRGVAEAEEDGHGDQGWLTEARIARVYGAIGVRTDEAAAETQYISIYYFEKFYDWEFLPSSLYYDYQRYNSKFYYSFSWSTYNGSTKPSSRRRWCQQTVGQFEGYFYWQRTAVAVNDPLRGNKYISDVALNSSRSSR